MELPSKSSKHSKVWLFIAFTIGCICLLLVIISISFIQLNHPPISTHVAPTVTSVASEPSVGASPEFPWPPPKPSAFSSLTLGSVGDLAGAGSGFGDVDSRITEALVAGGYDDKSYFGIPNGFTVVTRLEQINSDGYPEYSNRWASEITSISVKEFSISKYLEALFSIPQGRYRILVFIVTSDLVIQSGTPVSQGEAETWVVEGANKLPTWMETLPYTQEHTCTVYVYEFVQSGVGENANQNIPSNITGKQHLERAGLWDILEK